MNIALVTDTYLPRINGVVQSILTFAREFRKRGHRVVILAPQYPKQIEEEGEVWRFPSHYLPFSPEDRLPNPWFPLSRRIFKKLRSEKIEVIHTQTPFALGLAMIRRAQRDGIPAVHTYHTLFEAYMPHYFPWIPRAAADGMVSGFSRWFCNQHQAVVVPTSSVAERMRAYGITVPVERIPTGIDLSPFEAVDGGRMRQALGFQPGEIMLLTMGRVAREKNIPFLFQVLKNILPQFPRARLVVAGTGPAVEENQQECRRMGLSGQVVFQGLLNRRDWADLYAAADLQLLASVTETQGLVLTEAMAAGTPCVAVNEMGVKDVMEGGGGLAVSLNVGEFSDAVRRLLAEPALYKQKKAEALRQAQAWSSGAKAEEMLGLYGRLISQRKNQKV